jgi:hypothetical protein
MTGALPGKPRLLRRRQRKLTQGTGLFLAAKIPTAARAVSQRYFPLRQATLFGAGSFTQIMVS